MKRCNRCGWVSNNSENLFCEKCGAPLKDSPNVVGRTSKRPVLLAVAGCLLAVVLIGGGVLLGFLFFRADNGKEIVAQTQEADAGQQKENMENPVEGAEEEEIHQYQIPGSDSENQEEQVQEQQIQEQMTDVQETPVPTLEQEAIPETTTEPEYRTCYVVNCRESISLRKSPSTKAEAYCQIPLGAAVSYVAAVDNGFCQIIYNGRTGYALASYLSFDKEQGNSQEIQYMKVVNCKESISLRKTPSTKGEKFCQIPLGAIVEYKDTAENGFYMVSYNGYTGYALASYLTEW